MNAATRQLRSGFMGIEILLVVIIFTAIFGVISACTKPTTRDSPNADTGTAQTVTDTARAGSAVLRLTRDAGEGAPAVDAPEVDAPEMDALAVDPAIDPTVTDPAAGAGVLEMLRDFLEGVFGF